MRKSLHLPLLLVLVVHAAAAAVPWQHTLYLANGGYWNQRVAVTITNGSVEPMVGEPLILMLPALAGARVEPLRVCRSDGIELLFDLRDARVLAKRAGELSADDRLIVPVECPAHSATTLFVYAGNLESWAVPDFLPGKLADRATNSSNAGLRVSISEVERLQLKPVLSLTRKTGPDWRNWAEVLVRRFTEDAGSTALVRVNLRQALARLPGVSWDSAACVASSDGVELTSWHQFIRQSDEGKKYYWIRYPDGDGFLAYPGKPVGVEGPVSTIRLEQIREGLEDYEALTLLAELTKKAKQAGRADAAAERALAMARDLVTIPNAGGLRSTEILPNPDRIPAIRKAVNAALVHIITQKP